MLPPRFVKVVRVCCDCSGDGFVSRPPDANHTGIWIIDDSEVVIALIADGPTRATRVGKVLAKRHVVRPPSERPFTNSLSMSARIYFTIESSAASTALSYVVPQKLEQLAT